MSKTIKYVECAHCGEVVGTYYVTCPYCGYKLAAAFHAARHDRKPSGWNITESQEERNERWAISRFQSLGIGTKRC